ncbi:MAG: sterol desaturase family protein [Pseudomonadota bacterium]
MDSVFNTLTGESLYALERAIDDGFFVIAIAFLGFELLRYAIKRRLSLNLLGDTLANFATSAMFVGITYFLLAAFYVSAYVTVAQFAVFDIDIHVASIVACILLADFAYYWEHRFLHRVGIAWATHTVHHSSPHFNVSVAYRFGPMDGVWPLFFHLPLVLIGFDPYVVFFAEVIVQVYQTLLHTEVVRKLPRPIEAIMNTPSHHRVHHGSNPEYIDKNYGGILIIWDRLFGTFAEERRPVVYGITDPIKSVNPLTVFTHGFLRLFRKMQKAPGVAGKLAVMIRPPA